MLMAMLVLPVPGGPTRQSTPPFTSGASLRTDRNSITRSLTLERPKWSSSSMRWALAISSVSFERLFQGSSRQVSR